MKIGGHRKYTTRSLTSAMAIGAAIPLAVLASAAAIVHSTFGLTVSAGTSVNHATAVLAGASRVRAASQEALSTERGFALTGASEYLVAYGGATSDIGRQIGELRALVADDPAQVQRLTAVAALIDEWQRRFAAPVIELRRAHDDGQKTAAETTAAIKSVVDHPDNERLRHEIARLWEVFVGAERDLLVKRVETYEQTIRWARALTLGGPFLAVLLVSVAALLAASRLRRSLGEVSAAARDFTAGNRSRRAALPEIREVGAVALAFNDLAATLERREDEAASLRQFADLLAACRDVHEAAEVAASMGRRLFPGGGSLFMATTTSTAVDPLVSWGPARDEYVRSFPVEDCWALRRGKSFEVSLFESNALCCRHLVAEPDMSTLCVPLVAQGEAPSLLVLRWSLGTPGLPLTPPEREDLVHAFAEHLALALANLRLRERLVAQSIRDSLTGLYNRRYLEETLEREIARARRTQNPIGVVVFDIDHFKIFNDSYGHGGGDALLRAIGATMRSHLRYEDIACRYGGEEFVLVLPGATLADTERRAEELRRTVSALEVSDQGRALGTVSVSIGVAGYPDHGTELGPLVRIADAALYEAKRQGRNRVIVAGRPEPAAAA